MIKALNLDKNFSPTFCTQIKYEMFQFSGGEIHIKIDKYQSPTDVDKVIITNRFRNSDDLMRVLFAKDALERKGYRNFELVMPYIPYARQDRVCDEGESFTLKLFTQILNSAKFNKVFVVDPHSDVAPALIDNCVIIPNNEYVELAFNTLNFEDKKNVILISPDSGANKKINKLFVNSYFKHLVKCDKRRNTVNGNLDGFEVFSDDLNGRPCMIVDDICDGGRTFVGLAEELKKKNAGDIYLFATHGIFSYGTDELKKHFKKIFITDSFKTINDDELITQFTIQI